MTEIKQQETPKTPHRWKKGECPNPNGRPRKPEVELLRHALEVAKKKHGGKHLIEHAVNQAYHSDVVLIAILKKILPDQLEGKGFSEGVRTLIIERFAKENEPSRIGTPGS